MEAEYFEIFTISANLIQNETARRETDGGNKLKFKQIEIFKL